MNDPMTSPTTTTVEVLQKARALVYPMYAECWSGWEERDCPYLHHDTWHVFRCDEVFDTEQEALDRAIDLVKQREASQ